VAAAKLGQARIALARLETERKNAAEPFERLDAEATRLIEDIEREQAAKEEAEGAAENARSSN
jgi:chromosome segregation protein